MFDFLKRKEMGTPAGAAPAGRLGFGCPPLARLNGVGKVNIPTLAIEL